LVSGYVDTDEALVAQVAYDYGDNVMVEYYTPDLTEYQIG